MAKGQGWRVLRRELQARRRGILRRELQARRWRILRRELHARGRALLRRELQIRTFETRQVVASHLKQAVAPGRGMVRQEVQTRTLLQREVQASGGQCGRRLEGPSECCGGSCRHLGRCGVDGE